MNNTDVIVDLQYGSTGKGLLAGYLANKNKYEVVVNANMPNAGHTFINKHGRKWIHKVLPNGIVSPNLKYVMLGPGSVFDKARLSYEISESVDLLHKKTIIIHSEAVVLLDNHISAEKHGMARISSTMQGSGEAMVHKIRRPIFDSPTVGNKFGIGNLWIDGIEVEVVTNAHWVELINSFKNSNILLEGAQGYSLGINAGFFPYCTSRDCTPARFLSDCQIPIGNLRHVYGTARMHPIRVGNFMHNSSGPGYMDQQEILWEDIGVEPEITTVTGRQRRIFTFSKLQITEAITVCQPKHVFLNFCNYDADNSEKTINYINSKLSTLVPDGGQVSHTGWGATESDVRERALLNPCDGG